MVLYELLVGQVPFDVALLRKGGIGEVLRVLHEVEPLRPSAWLNATGSPRFPEFGVQAPPEPGERLTIADQRRLDVRGLARALKEGS